MSDFSSDFDSPLHLAITGLGCHAGPFDTLDALERALREGTADLGDAAVLAAEDHENRVCSAIEQALRAGRLAVAEVAPVGLILLLDGPRDPLAAQRCSDVLGLTGPAVTLPAAETGLAAAIDRARRELLTCRAIALCAADTAGAVAVLLADAGRSGAGQEERAYAVLDSVTTGTEGTTPPGWTSSVEYLGLGGESEPDREAAETELAAQWSADAVGRWGAVLAPTADTGSRAALAAVIRAALCLHHRYLPTSADDPRRETPSETRDSAGWYVPLESHPWIARADGARRAAVVWADGERRTRLSLSARTSRGELGYADWSRGTDLILLPIGGSDTGDLVAQIRRVREAVAAGVPLGALARESVRELSEAPKAALRAVLCVTPASVLTELDRALASLPQTHAEGRDWSSPGGSYCAVHPIGPDGKIALVFPGLFTAYAGFGQQLLRCFPGAHAVIDSIAGSHDREWLSDVAYRALGKYNSRAELAKVEEALLRDFRGLTALGVAFSRFHAEILRQLLSERTYGALGYSLGEVSMLLAVGPKLEESLAWALTMPWFRDDAEAAQRAAIAAWSAPGRSGTDPLWGSRVVFASADEIRVRLGRFDRVYLTHVNTPEEVVIAGDPEQCEALAGELGRPNIASVASHVFHTPLFDPRTVVDAELPSPRLSGELEMFTSNGCRPLRGTSEEIAVNVGEMLGRTVDFPRLVRAAYLSGYRYFLEVGPGGTCTRWIGDSLAGRPHVAEAVERRGVPGAKSLAQLMAKLVSHGVPVNLESLLPPSTGLPANSESLVEITA